ncbi:hypothetical protein GW17_00002537 [Ensete ventricosum]|nr:hypothetical protein GW17_00002537 [Ensete ventricosum]
MSPRRPRATVLLARGDGTSPTRVPSPRAGREIEARGEKLRRPNDVLKEVCYVRKWYLSSQLLCNACTDHDAMAVCLQGDVIVSFDGVQVGSEGTVPFRSTERIAFRYLISQK